MKRARSRADLRAHRVAALLRVDHDGMRQGRLMDHRDDISAAIKDIRDEIRCYERWSDSAKRQLRQLIRRASEVANYTDE